MVRRGSPTVVDSISPNRISYRTSPTGREGHPIKAHDECHLRVSSSGYLADGRDISLDGSVKRTGEEVSWRFFASKGS